MDYLKVCLGDVNQGDLNAALKKTIVGLGIQVRQVSEWPGFSQMWWVDSEEACKSITDIRMNLNNYRGPDQCMAEAEAMVLCNNANGCFVSQSAFLNRLGNNERKAVWKPDAMYQFLSMFCTQPPTTDMLSGSLTGSLLAAGFEIVDREAVLQYVGPDIKQARMTLQTERERYIHVIGEVRWGALEQGFEAVPDLEKPLYSMQVAVLVAKQASDQADKARIAVQKAREEAERVGSSLSAKERREYAKLKGRAEEKRRMRKKEKRRRNSQRKRH